MRHGVFYWLGEIVLGIILYLAMVGARVWWQVLKHWRSRQ
jgi:hypothetical protein